MSPRCLTFAPSLSSYHILQLGARYSTYMSFALFPLSNCLSQRHCSSMQLSPLLNHLYIMEQHPSLQSTASRRAFPNMTGTAPHLNNITCPPAARNYNLPEYVRASPIRELSRMPDIHIFLCMLPSRARSLITYSYSFNPGSAPTSSSESSP
jgi:hypothetical protein